MQHALSAGSMQVTLESNGTPNPYPDPVVQVLSIKKVVPGPGSTSTTDRYRLILSDGVHYVQAMAATHLNELMESGQIAKNGIVKLRQFVCNTVNAKRIIIVLQLDMLTPGDTTLTKIGSPVGLETPPGGAATGAAPRVAALPAAPAAQPMAYQAPPAPVAQFKQPAAPIQHQPYGGGGAMTGGYGGAPAKPAMNDMHVFPIKSLNPYQNKWTIRARILNKSDIKHWSNAKGEGRLFSMTLGDESGEIRATGFNDAVDAFYDMLQENQVYYISKGAVKVVRNKQFSNVNNDYEMSIDPQTSFILCTDGSSVPGIRYNPVDLAQLGQVEKDATVDVITVAQEVGEVTSFVSKNTQKELKKRELVLVDASGYSVRMTLWNRVAETFQAPAHSVLAFKGARVGDFGGRTLSASGSTSMAVNPDIPEAHRLRGWYDAKGRNMQFQTFAGLGGGSMGSGAGTPLKLVAQIKDEGLGMGEKPDYAMLQGAISFVKTENVSYPACPSEGCNKKVMEAGGMWRCEKCDKSYPAPLYRYILTMSMADFTGQAWLQAFNDAAEQLLGITANDLQVIKETRPRPEYDAVFSKVLFQTCQFKVRMKAETYQDELKVRTSVMDVAPVNYAAASTRLLQLLEAMG